jgi:hypothetical protein
MGTYRHRLLASLALAGATLAMAACALLLRPPAAAAQKGQQQFLFGPVWASEDQLVEVRFANLSHQPTPPALLEFIDQDDGSDLGHQTLPATTPPNGGGGAIKVPGNGVVVIARLTFAAPTGNQAVPVPFAATMNVEDPTLGSTRAVVYPVR